jgi:hypothetical protein
MSRLKLLALVAGVFVMFSSTAMAAGIKAKPGVYDPDNTGIITSRWITRVGLPDSGKSNHAILLEKDGATATNAAAYVVIDGVEGMPVVEFGYDIRNGSHCGAGAPRFNLEATDGFHFLGGCANATLAPAPDDPTNWTRVRIDPFSPTQAFPPVTPGATIVSLTILFDEGTDTPLPGAGSALIDNIDVNGTLIGKPGNA